MTALFLLLIMHLGTSIETTPIVLEETFELTKGETAIYVDGNISIHVLKVMDSRCPENTNCIWAGELGVELEITHNKETKTHNLVVPAVGAPNERAVLSIGDLKLNFLGQPNNKTNKAVQTDKNPLYIEFVLSSESDTIKEK